MIHLVFGILLVIFAVWGIREYRKYRVLSPKEKELEDVTLQEKATSMDETIAKKKAKLKSRKDKLEKM